MISEKTRICILSECAWPDIGGGVTQALGLAKFLKENGYNVFFLTQTKGLKLPKKDEIDSIPIYRVFSLGYRYGKYIMILPSLFSLIKNRKEYDLIYVCGFRILGLLGVVVSKLCGKKCLLKAESIGEYSGEIFRWNLDLFKNRIISRLSDVFFGLRNVILRKADGFIAINRIIEEEFYSGGIRKGKIHYIPNGIDRESFHPIETEKKGFLRKRLGLPIDKKIVIYTGRLNKGKGLEMLLGVWRGIVKDYKNVFLIIAGSGGNQFLTIEMDLKDYVMENRMQNFVLFTGYVYNISEYLMASDIFVLPSELEGLSCSLLEALACGLPVITTNVGGAPELIESGKNGILIKLNSPKELENAIVELLNSKLIIKGSLPNDFYLDSVFKKYDKLIRSLF